MELHVSQRGVRPSGRLAELEKVIEHGVINIGNAMREIRDDRLYRETHSTFEDYCQERWGYGRNYINKQIAAASTAELVGTNVPIPNEAQARELTPLARERPEEAARVWDEVIEEHGKDVTAADVRHAVRAGSVGESLTEAIEAGGVPEIPPRQMSESQKQGYKSVERYYTLSHYDPEEVAKAHDPAKDHKSWSEEVERTERLMNWIERYQDALIAMQEKY